MEQIEMARKRKKADEASPPAASTSASDPASGFRPWPDLPQDILLAIRDRFSLSIADLVAFSAVCRSWRSAASAASVAPFTGPPLLLVPYATHSRSGLLQWSGPPQCRLKALTETTRSYRSAISSKTLKLKCVGYSNGQLILVDRKRGVIADVFTGREVHPPDFPAGDRRFAFGILTAPLSSASCLLLLVSYYSPNSWSELSNIICWKPGTDDWSELEIEQRNGVSFVIMMFKDRILAMDSYCHLIEVEFFPRPSWNFVHVTKQGGVDFIPKLGFDQYLVECGEELLLVYIMSHISIEVYHLEWSSMVWLKMEGLVDWC